MAIQKNFVVKNGLEVNDTLIFADKTQNTVGIGTTITPEKLQVNGGIGATSLVLSGVGTIPTLQSTNGTITNLTSTDGTITTLDGTTLKYDAGYIVSGVVTSLSGNTLDYSGIATVGSISIGVTEVVSSSRQLKNIVSLDAITTATIEAAIANEPNTFTNLVVTGISTLGVTGITTLNVTGIATLGTVQISSGIITASSGIVTYYGDGTNLSLTGNPDLISSTGIGIGTTGGLVGYGVTFLDLKGAGVSTSIYNSSVGIATIFFEGGSGTGAIGIGSTFPGTPGSTDLPPSNGDLFYHIDYGRTFIYYDEAALGVGISTYWVDSSPFNVGIISGVAFSDGTASNPSWYFGDDITTGVFSPSNGQLTFVSTGSSILNVNQSGVIVTGVSSATSFVRSGGTSSQFLKADGSIDSNTYLTSYTETDTLDSVTTRGSTTSNNISVGILTATSLIRSGGTSSQFLKADGSIDSNTYLTSYTETDTLNSVTTRGSTTSNNISVGIITSTSFVRSGGTSSQFLKADGSIDSNTYLTSYTETQTLDDVLTLGNTSSLGMSVGVVTCTDLNSTSDINLKENITTVDNALSIVNDLRGVKFEWKKDHKPSYGVIAQELEQILPELVTNTGPKTVNYNGIIGVLIEAVKELSAEVEDLKNKLS